MATQSTGTHNQPQFTEAGTMDIGTDLTAVSQYMALVGNRKYGTTGERLALTGAARWDGLQFFDTDLDHAFVWNGSSWDAGPVYISDASAYVTMSANWSLTNAQMVLDGAFISWRVKFNRTTSTVGSTASGNITNVDILTLNDANKRPMQTYGFSTDNTGFLCGFELNTAGVLKLTALPPNIGVAVGNEFSCSGTYFRDVTA